MVLKDAVTAIRTAGERIVRLEERMAALMRMRGFTQIGAIGELPPYEFPVRRPAGESVEL